MITIKNNTGVGYDTKIFDKNGNDLTEALGVFQVKLNIVPDRPVECLLFCFVSDFEMADVVIKNNDAEPGGRYHVHKISNYFEMKKAGFSRIN